MAAYRRCYSIDLRCFDNSLPDYGVGNYIERLGCVPDLLMNHETYVDQIHMHAGVIDDTFLEPQWTSQRAVPGVQRWTKRQFKGLIEALHAKGIRIYQGAEAAWNYWPEYGLINRCDYTYENFSELFILHANGRTSEEERGCINPLKHLKSGEWYEDILVKDLLCFLNDYDMDGFFAADGFAGLDCPVDQGDFSEDMVNQFEAYSEIEVPDLPVNERADWILANCRYEWTCFYADRWADFYRKLSGALYAGNKELAIFSPWTEGPADSLRDYGIDYGKLSKAGVKVMCLEVMEEVIGRRWHNGNAWEISGIAAAITAKLQAPDMEILWTAATANIPEHWHTFRDLANILRREALAIGSAGVIDDEGFRRKAFDGFLTIFGIDLTKEEWKDFHGWTDTGFGFGEKANMGLCLLWSDSILYEHVRRGETWAVREAAAQLHFSGVPVQCGCTIKGMAKARGIDAFLLADPIGITDEEVRMLEKAGIQGSKLVVMGRVEHPGLQRLLKVRPFTDRSPGQWEIVSRQSLWLQGVPELSGMCNPGDGLQTAGATELITDGARLLAGCTENTLYLGVLRKRMPDFAMPKNAAELNCNRPVFPRQAEESRTLRECAEAFVSVHPDYLELAAGRCIYFFLPQIPVTDKGQYYGLRRENDFILLAENTALPVYCVSEYHFPEKAVYCDELPQWRLGPLGYRYWYPDADDRLYISLPPDACVPYRVIAGKSNAPL